MNNQTLTNYPFLSSIIAPSLLEEYHFEEYFLPEILNPPILLSHSLWSSGPGYIKSALLYLVSRDLKVYASLPFCYSAGKLVGEGETLARTIVSEGISKIRYITEIIEYSDLYSKEVFKTINLFNLSIHKSEALEVYRKHLQLKKQALASTVISNIN